MGGGGGPNLHFSAGTGSLILGPRLLLHLPTIGMLEAGDAIVNLVWSEDGASAERVVFGLRTHATIAGQPFAVVETDQLGLTVVVGGDAAVEVVSPAGLERVVGRTPDEPVEMRFDGPVHSVTVGVPGPEPCAACPPALVGVGSATVGPGWVSLQRADPTAAVPPVCTVAEASPAALDAVVEVPLLASRSVAALGGGFMGVSSPPAPPQPAPAEASPGEQSAPPLLATAAFGLLEPLASVQVPAVPPPVAIAAPVPWLTAEPSALPPSPPSVTAPTRPTPPATPAAETQAISWSPPPSAVREDRTTVIAPLRADYSLGGDHTVLRPDIAGVDPGSPLRPPSEGEDRTTVIAPLRADDSLGGDHTILRPDFAGVDLGSPPPPPIHVHSGPVVRSRRCSCAALNAPGREHCRSCGAPLLQDRPLVTGPRPTLGTLEFDDGLSEPIDGPLVIGRRPPSRRTVAGEQARTIQVDDPSQVVSGFHLEVRVDEWAISIVDYGSTNGTWITPPRGTAIRLRASEPTPLVHGCEVSLGGGRSFVYSET